MATPRTSHASEPVVSVLNPNGAFPLLLVCEHASNHIPRRYGDLGLPPEALNSHIAWDPGAKNVATKLSNLLNAPLVYSEVSRLVFDCNRSTEAPDAIPKRSERFDIPGNIDIDAGERDLRIENYYRPFEHCVRENLARLGPGAALVTVHSFTPVYHGKLRDVELGILHDSDSRLADAMLTIAPSATKMNVQRNMPYDAKDGVTHTLKLHGIANGILNVMLEIRNDLVANEDQCRTLAGLIHSVLTKALETCRLPANGRRTA